MPNGQIETYVKKRAKHGETAGALCLNWRPAQKIFMVIIIYVCFAKLYHEYISAAKSAAQKCTFKNPAFKAGFSL